jgi:hypothetical protein
MITIHAALLIVAFFCFLLNAFSVSPPRGNLLGLGLCMWVLSELLK